MKKIILFLLIFFSFHSFIESSIEQLDSIKKQQEVKKLKDDLYALEGSIFYKKYLSPINTLRENTAFLIAIAGLCGSIIAPFKIVKTNSGQALLGTRLAVMATTLCATTTAACAVSFFRPFLWFAEHKRESLKKKIFELEKSR